MNRTQCLFCFFPFRIYFPPKPPASCSYSMTRVFTMRHHPAHLFHNFSLPHILTNEAGRRWVGLNLLFCVLLDDVPKLPYKLRMKNVEWLTRVFLTMLNVWSEQVVIWLLVPLRGKQTKQTKSQSGSEDHTKKVGACVGGGGL